MAATTARDFLPIPDTTLPVSDPDHQEVAHSLTEAPSESHVLAQLDREDSEKGTAEQYHEDDVLDLGWNAHSDKIPPHLVARLANDDLWALIRRFNKVILLPCALTSV